MQMPPFLLGTQYFRPPFPRPEYWEDDLRAMADAGLHAVQLWLVWGWCEPEPGRFVFDDYDRIADLAADSGLGLVLSTLPEINPFWVPRLHPDAAMVDVEGRPVPGCNRWECLSGLVPGACSDNPDIRQRMTDFLFACGEHFGPRENLLAWDCWNENRWRNMAPDTVCFCDYSLASFRTFLGDRYENLERLGEAWGRRYAAWEDVRVGRMYGYSYPEMHDFVLWCCHRALEMATWRTEALRTADPDHPVSNHTGLPSVFGGANLREEIFSRGVDWDVAVGDTYGFSSFPNAPAGRMSPEDICIRLSSTTTAGGGKPIWMSELQGGPCAINGRYGDDLSGAEQQAWIWSGIGRGIRAAIFWCWRPEIFGLETNGFGMLSNDGLAGDRLEKLRQTRAVLDRKGGPIGEYRPREPEVAVLFERDSYFYGWMQREFDLREGGGAGGGRNHAARNTLGWLHGLERLHIPYALHDDQHLPEESGPLRFVIVPDAEGLNDAAARWLVEFAARGGSVFIEGIAGMRDRHTFLRYPNERTLFKSIGLREALHRRVTCDAVTIPVGALDNEEPLEIYPSGYEATFAFPQAGVEETIGGMPLLAVRKVGKGCVVALGTLVAGKMNQDHPVEFDAFLGSLLRFAAVRAPVEVRVSGGGFAACRIGAAGGRQLLFVSNFGEAQSVFLELAAADAPPEGPPDAWFGHAAEREAEDGKTILGLRMDAWDYEVLDWS